MAKKYYAVRVGKKTGVFLTWDECKNAVHGYPGAVYKSFPTKEEAEDFAGGKIGSAEPSDQPDVTEVHGEMPANFAFVDGSYNSVTKVYGYGGYLKTAEGKFILQGSGTDEEMASMRNVAGEISGCMAAVEKAIELKLPEITVYYDYMGIEMWAEGSWKRNKEGTIQYHAFMQEAMKKLKIHFVKVKGHSGVEGNEEADILAKKAVGILTE